MFVQWPPQHRNALGMAQGMGWSWRDCVLGLNSSDDVPVLVLSPAPDALLVMMGIEEVGKCISVLLGLPSCCFAEHPRTPSSLGRLCLCCTLPSAAGRQEHSLTLPVYGVENSLPDSEACYSDAGCTKWTVFEVFPYRIIRGSDCIKYPFVSLAFYLVLCPDILFASPLK